MISGNITCESFFFFFDSKSISYFAIMRDMIREINLHENVNVIYWIRI